MEKPTRKTNNRLNILLSILFLISLTKCDEWLEPLSSRFKLVEDLKKHASDLIAFGGNNSYTDNFKLLLGGDNYIIVGGRNIVYNLSLPSLKEVEEEVSRDEPKALK